MSAWKTFLELSNLEEWKERPRKVRILAARYFSGVDSEKELFSLTLPQQCLTDHTLPPTITHQQAITIRDSFPRNSGK